MIKNFCDWTEEEKVALQLAKQIIYINGLQPSLDMQERFVPERGFYVIPIDINNSKYLSCVLYDIETKDSLIHNKDINLFKIIKCENILKDFYYILEEKDISEQVLDNI